MAYCTDSTANSYRQAQRRRRGDRDRSETARGRREGRRGREGVAQLTTQHAQHDSSSSSAVSGLTLPATAVHKKSQLFAGARQSATQAWAAATHLQVWRRAGAACGSGDVRLSGAHPWRRRPGRTRARRGRHLRRARGGGVSVSEKSEEEGGLARVDGPDRVDVGSRKRPR